MVGLPANLGDDQSSGLNAAGFELSCAGYSVRDAVVANQRISQDEYLSPVGWIGKRLRISHHSGVKNDFTGRRCEGSEMLTYKGAVVLEQQYALGLLVFHFSAQNNV